MTDSSTDAWRATTLRITLDEAAPRLDTARTDEDIAAYYRTHVPDAGPPLEEIRDHVVAALARESSAPIEYGAIATRASEVQLHRLVALSEFLHDLPPGPAVFRFVSELHSRWFDASAGATRFDQLANAMANDGYIRRSSLPDDVWAALVSDARNAANCLRAASDAGHKFRLTPELRSVPVREQLDVLQRVGITLYDGKTPWAALFWQYSESDVAANPWYELLHVFEENHGLFDLGMKGAEPEDECYGRVVRTVSEVCRGHLPATDIESSYDEDSGCHRVHLTLDGNRESFDSEPSGRWLDAGLVPWLASLLSKRGNERLYTLEYRAELGDGLPLLCCDRNDASRLRVEGVPLVELGPKP